MIYETIDIEEFEVCWPDRASKQVLMTCYGDAVFHVQSPTTVWLVEVRLTNGITGTQDPLVINRRILREPDADPFMLRLFRLLKDQLEADERIQEQLATAYKEVA